MKNSNETPAANGQWFHFSPREIDILYSLWNGSDPWIIAKQLGISRIAFVAISSKKSIQSEFEKYYRAVKMSTEDRTA
jgi:hypothetical protein